MPDLRKAQVILYPAELAGRFVQILISRGSMPRQLEFTTLADLKAQISTIAAEHGAGCSVGVHLTDGKRKPSGFDAATRNLTYNLPAQ